MRRLFQNLIGNAVKFAQNGVPARVRIGASPWTAQGKAKGWEILVEDNGIGFDEKFLDRIFKPFHRLHARSEYEGSGIGLDICQKIVERHGGELTARSRSGEGATFILRLPN
jgi:signal transduction histidine kinase